VRGTIHIANPHGASVQSPSPLAVRATSKSP